MPKLVFFFKSFTKKDSEYLLGFLSYTSCRTFPLFLYSGGPPKAHLMSLCGGAPSSPLSSMPMRAINDSSMCRINPGPRYFSFCPLVTSILS
jgi:hypothetical protein